MIWGCSLLTGVLLSQLGGAQNAPKAAALSAREGQKLLYQFRKSQAEERRNLVTLQRKQFKEFKLAQDLRFKEWNQRENAARREYFSGHAGPEKREYMRDLKARRHTFERLLKDEKATRLRENEVRLKAVEEDQKMRLQRFRDFISRGEEPPRELWPDR